MRDTMRAMIVPGLVLSGGFSQRMGAPKALLEIAGETFLARIVRTLREGGVDDVVVVTGAHDAVIRASIDDWRPPALAPRVVFNSGYARGQLTSLLAGLAAVDHPGVSAVLVALVDHPFVGAGTVATLLARWRATRAPVVRPQLGGRHGHPVIFDRSVFDALRHAPLDEGARAVVRACGAAVLDVPVDDEGVILDIDTPEQFAAVQGRQARS